MVTEATVISSGPGANSYDAIPYESHPFAQTHPDRLATMAKLFGLDAKPIENCRVLELGCASGGNILPLASAYPNSSFVGIDLAQGQVEDGNKIIDGCKLKNIKIQQMNICDIDEDFGKFDYIIAHGIYSWVPAPVQDALLRVCKNNLEANGVAYVSYNVFPGWHLRGMVREMMIYHAGHMPDTNAKATQAKALLEFLSQSIPEDDKAYRAVMKEEIEFLRNEKDYYFIHEYLEDVNLPVYFFQFIEHAQSHELQFLSEADLSIMLTSQFQPRVMETLHQISNDIVRTEQYMDFLRNRMFRQTLLCHAQIPLKRSVDSSLVPDFYIEGEVRAEQDGSFRLSNGTTIQTTNSMVQAALRLIGECYPQSIHFNELLNKSIAESGVRDEDRAISQQTLSTDILTLYSKGALDLRTSKASFVSIISERPKTTELARYQAKHSNTISTHHHKSVSTDVLSRSIVEFCDGTNTESEILQHLVERVKSGELLVHADGKALTDETATREVLLPRIKETLQRMANAAMLIA